MQTSQTTNMPKSELYHFTNLFNMELTRATRKLAFSSPRITLNSRDNQGTSR